MRIDKIEIENFKLFAKQSFEFNPEFNLLVGINGSGKTSLLRAIAVALGGWAHAYIKNEKNYRTILDEEVREIQLDNRFDKSKETSIRSFGQAIIIDSYNKKKNAQFDWARIRYEGGLEEITGSIKYQQSSGYSSVYRLSFDVLGQDILTYIENNQSFDLPLIAFYECDRLWLAKNELNIEASAKAKYSRFDPYIDCFHTGADHQAIGEWLLKYELVSLQKQNQQDTPILHSIKNAARGALENCTDIKFDFEQSRVMVEFTDNKAIPFEYLSDGQRTLLGLFCDIARRVAILNPHFGGEASTNTSGVVLIDELDLHLHPIWQRKVIENLRTLFPKIQFFCTTHSPFIIQSLRSSDELIMLDNDPLAEYGNKGIEDIAKNMGVLRPDVSVRYEEMKNAAKDYLQLLDEMVLTPEEKQECYQKKLAELVAPYADNPAYQAFLELKYAVKAGE